MTLKVIDARSRLPVGGALVERLRITERHPTLGIVGEELEPVGGTDSQGMLQPVRVRRGDIVEVRAVGYAITRLEAGEQQIFVVSQIEEPVANAPGNPFQMVMDAWWSHAHRTYERIRPATRDPDGSIVVEMIHD